MNTALGRENTSKTCSRGKRGSESCTRGRRGALGEHEWARLKSQNGRKTPESEACEMQIPTARKSSENVSSIGQAKKNRMPILSQIAPKIPKSVGVI